MLYVVLAETFTEYKTWLGKQSKRFRVGDDDSAMWIAAAYQVEEVPSPANRDPRTIHWVVLPNFYKRADAIQILEAIKARGFKIATLMDWMKA
jgi:hypothetical protein